MVGYDQDETLTPNQKIIAGCISGAMTRFITQPLDIIKLRTQLQKKGALGQRRFFRTTRAILKEEGLTAFWAGHNLGQINETRLSRYRGLPPIIGTALTAVRAQTSSQFYAYELSTKFIMNHTNPDHKHFYVFFCGIFAGCCSATLVLPIEVIRVRQMLVKAQYGGLLQGARQVYSTGGFLAFYEGLGAALLQMGPSSGISFAVFRFTQPLVLHFISSSTPVEQKERHAANLHKPHVMLIASALAGSMAGFVAKTCTYPFDLAKRRLQISAAGYLNWISARNKALRGGPFLCGLQYIEHMEAPDTYLTKSHKDDKRYPIAAYARDPIRCHNMIECLTMTVMKEGIFGLYRGWTITSYLTNIKMGLLFATYEGTCWFLRHLKSGFTSDGYDH